MSMTCREVIENSENIFKCIEDPIPTGELVSTIVISVVIVIAFTSLSLAIARYVSND